MLGLLLGLVAVLAIAVVTLEDYSCARFSFCILSLENITRVELIEPAIAIVNLATPRPAPMIESAREGLIITADGTTALFVGSEPIAQDIQVRPKPATESDIALGVDRLTALPIATLAGLAADRRVDLKAHPEFAALLAARLEATQIDLNTCTGLNQAGWLLATLSTLGAQQTAPSALTLSLMTVALECDLELLPGLIALEAIL